MAKYRYELSVVETAVSTAVIDSERKLRYDEVKAECERRRVGGTLDAKKVTKVDSWIDHAYEDGQELHERIFAD